MPRQRREPDPENTNRRDEIADALRARISAGEFVPGAVVPSVREVADEYGCARMTAQSALQILANEGTITTRHRRGSVVALAQRSVAGPVERLRYSRAGGLRRPGETTEILSARVHEAATNPDAAAAYGVAEGGLLGVREYLIRDADGTVNTYGHSYFSLELWEAVPELRSPSPIVDGAIGAIRRTLNRETLGVPTPRAALEATEEEAAALGVEAGSPVLVEVTRCLLDDDTVVEYAVYVHPRGYWVGK